MKQHISDKEIDELSPGSLKKIQTWCQKKIKSGEASDDTQRIVWKGVLFLTIGEMIEFLDEHGNFGMSRVETQDPLVDVWELDSNDEWIIEAQNKELCDALWEAVKEMLENVQ